MKVIELSPDIQAKVSHIPNWQSMISDEVAGILHKLSAGEDLSRSENNLDVTPSEVAAIWSLTNDRPIEARYVREVKRDGRIQPSKEWGIKSGRRSLYKVKAVKDIRIISTPGRHKGSKNKKKEETLGAA